MKRAMKHTTLLFALLLPLSACAGFQLQPAASRGSQTIAQVSIEISPELNEGKREALAKYEIPAHMQAAISGSFPAGEGPTLRVTITEFRTGSFGPTRMHARAEVIAASGEVLRTADADASAMMGGTTMKLRKVAQSVVDQVVTEVSQAS